MSKKGLTLIELIGAILILGVLLAIGTGIVQNVLLKSKEDIYDIVVKQIEEGAKQYVWNYKHQISGLETIGIGYVLLSELVEKDIIREHVVNPASGEEFPEESAVKIIEIEDGAYQFEFLISGVPFDLTPPINVVASIGNITSNSMQVIGSAIDEESGIARYAFSKDNGLIWTKTQASNSYTFTNLLHAEYGIRVRAYNGVGLYADSTVVLQTTPLFSPPTYSVAPAGWAQSKIVTIDYQTNDYIKEYSTNGGSTWLTSANQIQTVNFNANGSVIARISDGVNVVTANTLNVTQIDNTPPSSATATIGTVTTNSIEVIGSGIDAGSGIVSYAFSKDNGSTWTTPQANNVYMFTGLTYGTYPIRVRVYDGVDLFLNSAAVNQTLVQLATPTYSVTPSGWAQSKTVTINYQTAGNIKEYSTNGGSTWTVSDNQLQQVTFNVNGSVIARVSDGLNTITASVYNVTQIDTTSPTVPTISRAGIYFFTVTAGTDAQSGVDRTTYQLSGATVVAETNYTSNVTVSNTGTTSIIARTYDNAGNFSSGSASVAVSNSTCPSGWTKSGTTCQQTQSADVWYSCPHGGSLSGTTCYTSSTYQVYTEYHLWYTCPSGTWTYHSQTCLGNCSAPCADGNGSYNSYKTADYCTPYSGGQSCSVGSQAGCMITWVGTCCCTYGSYSATANYSCPSGWTLSGSTCYQYTSPICSSGTYASQTDRCYQ
jgi:prepilin-type N-terminal cleavage/methylation domain-containing protein